MSPPNDPEISLPKTSHIRGYDYPEAIRELLTRFAVDAFDLKSIIIKAVEQVCEILETDYCLVLQYVEEEQLLKKIGGTISIPNLKLDSDQECDATYALKNKKTIIVNDYKHEKGFSKLPIKKNIKSGASVIVKGADKVYGICGIYSEKPDYFTELKINFLQVIGIIIGVSIERNVKRKNYEKLNQDLKEKIKRAKELQRKILKTNVYERWKIGKYLNEELAQDLLATDLIIRSLVQNSGQWTDVVDLEDLQRVIERAVLKTIEKYEQLVPVDVEVGGITHSFHQLEKHTEQSYQVNCMLENSEILERIEDVERATQLYRIAQESVKNAIIYRKAKNITLQFGSDKTYLYLKIKDDGKLFSTLPIKGEAMGIDIINHYIEIIGGSLEIKGNPKGGLLKTFKLPWKV